AAELPFAVVVLLLDFGCNGLRFRGRRRIAQTGCDRCRARADGLAFVFPVLAAVGVLLLAHGRRVPRPQRRQHDEPGGRARASAVCLALAVLFLAVEHGDLGVRQRRRLLSAGCARTGAGRIGLALVVLLLGLEYGLAPVIPLLDVGRRDLRFGLQRPNS